VTVNVFEFHPKTSTVCSPPKPIPFAVSVPETVKDVPRAGFAGDAVAVSEVETGLVSEPVLRFNVIVPGALNVARVGSFEPEHASPPVQLQLETV
jgi:hypothetical protein